MIRRIFGTSDSASGLQMVPRLGAFTVFCLGLAWAVSACLPATPATACMPACPMPASAIDEAQASVPVEERLRVAVYGDSRAWSLAEGSKLVPGWAVTNKSRQGCAFLDQEHTWKRYVEGGSVGERSSAEQTTGETLYCNTHAYIYSSSVKEYDLAIVYAGTLLAADSGFDENVHSPTDPVWAQYLEDNLVASLSRIPAERIVIVSTPRSTNTNGYDIPVSRMLWSQPERVAAINAILAKVAVRIGATYLPEFGPWVESLPDSCQPDGSHFTVECATDAGQWIKNNL